MEIIDAASSKQGHPRTTNVERAIVYRFSTGHRLTRWADGTRFYSNTRGALNPRVATRVCNEMDSLAAAFDAKPA